MVVTKILVYSVLLIVVFAKIIVLVFFIVAFAEVIRSVLSVVVKVFESRLLVGPATRFIYLTILQVLFQHIVVSGIGVVGLFVC